MDEKIKWDLMTHLNIFGYRFGHTFKNFVVVEFLEASMFRTPYLKYSLQI